MTDHDSRRAFIRKGVVLAGGAVGTLALNGMGFLGGIAAAGTQPDLVAVKNGSPGAMFDAAITAMGGMRQFVRPNQSVVIKPNIGWNRGPETGANTHPELVGRIVEHCLDAGAKKVYVFDHSVDNGPRCYENSGIAGAVTARGGIMVPGNHERYYQETANPRAKTLTSTRIHELILESDVYINVPVLKHHASSGLSLAMKNQMGVVWNRGVFHWRGLHQSIADVGHVRPPDLNVMDGYRITLRNGPSRAGKEDVVVRKTLLLSPDMVAIDAAATRIFGQDPGRVRHIRLAHEAGIGTMDLSSLRIQRLDLSS